MFNMKDIVPNPLQPGLLELSDKRKSELLALQPLTELYAVEDQPFARGKFAAVKRCIHLEQEREYAAKVIRKRRRGNGPTQETWHEAAVLDLCRHCPHIVQLQGVFDAPGESVLLLELASGGELQSVLDRDEIPEEHDVRRFLRQVLSGLQHLHSLDIAHLDLKPQNLLLTGPFPECDIKLCDFGIARHIARNADVREILGTPDYVAPEVLNYEPISLATDMWSVGVLAYVLLTGCTPFGGDTKQETFCNITRCHLDFPEDLFDEISTEATNFIASLLVKDASSRLTALQCLDHPWLRDTFPILPCPTPPVVVESSELLQPVVAADVTDASSTIPTCPKPLLADVLTSTQEEALLNNEFHLLHPTSSTPRVSCFDYKCVYPVRLRRSLPVPRYGKTRRDGSWDRELGYASDGVSEASSGADSSSDRSSIISLEDAAAPQDWVQGVHRRYSDTSLRADRLCERMWECFLPSTPGYAVMWPTESPQPASPRLDAGTDGSKKPWEKICTGSVARAVEKFKEVPAAPEEPNLLVPKNKSPIKVTEMKWKYTTTQRRPSNPGPLKTPLLPFDKNELVKSRLGKFQSSTAC